MRTLFIVNPKAGRGLAEKIWTEMDKTREIDFPDSTYIKTEYPGHAKVIAENIDFEHTDAVISVGGDGTIHEIVNGIALQDIALGIIPAGSGNDLARTLKIPVDHHEAVRLILKQETRMIDMGLAGSRYFINIGGVGFDAEVVADMNTHMKFLKGTTAYVASVLKKLFTFVPIKLKIRIDETVLDKKVYICAVANGKYYGGGMMLAPNAVIDDGMFDICILEDLNKFEFLYTFPTVFKGNHIKHPKVKIYHGKTVKIEGPGNLSIHADGEIFGKLPADFRILPKSLKVISP